MPLPPTGSDGNGAAGEGAGGRPLSPEERTAFEARTRELSRRLDKVRGAGARKGGPRREDDDSLMGRAMNVSSMLIGSVIVGAAMGWGLDQWLGTWPKLFVVFFLLGACAGMLSVVRTGLAMRTGPDNPKAGPSVRDDDDET